MTSEAERFERATIFEAQNYDEKKSQAQMALEYMQRFGSITPLEALSAFNCFRLGARIADLRAEGYEIITTINDGKKRYAIYSLKGETDE